MPSVVALVEACQVELQGRYSLARFRGVLLHATTTTWPTHLTILLLTPIPSLLLNLVIDALPVSEPQLPIERQSAWVYVRLFLVPCIMAHLTVMQLHQSAPTLPLSSARLVAISTTVGLACVPGFYAYGRLIGFPTPFVIPLLIPIAVPVLITALWLSWRAALRDDPRARANLTRYVTVFHAQISIIYVYTAYGIAFTKLDKSIQPFMALGLPFIKLAFKNLVSKGVFHMEDLAPMTIVFNVDVFHALFVSSAMQQAASSGTTWTVMVVDAVQFAIALCEIHVTIRRVHRLARACTDPAYGHNVVAREPSLSSQSIGLCHETAMAMLELSVVDYAVYVVDTCPAIRDHPQVSWPRHLRDPSHGFQTHTGSRRQVAPAQQTVIATATPSATKPPSDGNTLRPATTTTVSVQPRPRDHTDQHQLPVLESVTRVLQMLHMIESYVLIEFAEVAVAAVYTLYMWALVYLPNRAYYPHLAHLSDTDMRATVTRLALYTMLELASFLVFCAVVDRKLRRVSTIQQLAFVLHKHARMALTTLAMWVFYIPQLSFHHFGADYTFQFEWLRGRAT